MPETSSKRSVPGPGLLLLRADARPDLGAGHLLRCLALAQGWLRAGGAAVMVSDCARAEWRERVERAGVRLELVTGHDVSLRTLEACARRLDPVAMVFDGYEYDAKLQRRAKEFAPRLLVLDDYVHADQYYADIVVNPNLGAEHLHYPCAPSTRLLLGSRYALLRGEFMDWRGFVRKTPDRAQRILVTLGGGDSEGMLLEVVEALAAQPKSVEARVLLGQGETQAAEVETRCRIVGFELLQGVEDMCPHMAWADMAVSAGGGTCWELAFMGLPNLVVVLAENQRGAAEALHQAGISRTLKERAALSYEHLISAIADLASDAPARRMMAAQGRALVDGLGADRVVVALRGE